VNELKHIDDNGNALLFTIDEKAKRVTDARY